MRHSIFIAICMLFVFATNIMGFEEIVYTPVHTDGKIEIRDYESVVVAEVITDGQRQEGEDSAFRKLFRYISARNSEKQKIAMTTPVTQQLVSGAAEETAASAEPQTEQENKWTFTFFLPYDMKLENAPQPDDASITLRTLQPRQLIALRFNGGRNERNVATHEEELRAYLAENNIDYLEPPLYAFYNGPFTPNFMRRNEILFELPSPHTAPTRDTAQ